ncbi:hypothetical protein KIMH_04820 [Bombiscardovia apis]|uniref:Uncharacterized protein n=2 Tax=Bombiscardovia apis TaxID=2932182 RepID=A0ABN6SEC3_9BIFI|nr:hypothetical protein KIMH_04820 [Bombiscardovia apis]
MPGLEDLQAWWNQIDTIGNFTNPNIVNLSLYKNKISTPALNSVNWSQLLQLKYLLLGQNLLVDISRLTNIPNLNYLSVDGNQIATLGELNNPNLTYLSIGQGGGSASWDGVGNEVHSFGGGNKITDSSFTTVKWNALTKLQTLQMYGNQITSLDNLPSIPTLLVLDAGMNKIDKLGQLNFPNLTNLRLSQNKVTSAHIATTDWSKLVQLQKLWLDSNQITSLSMLNTAWAPFIARLSQLSLNSNQITDVSTVDWSKFTALTNPNYILDNQQVRLPDIPTYSDNPLNLGPAIISHSPDVFAIPDKYNWNNTDVSTPAGGSYNTANGFYTWPHSYPGDYIYGFTGTIQLPNASGPTNFNGRISQKVLGVTVTFDANGGTLHTPAVQALANVGDRASAPNPRPTKEGEMLVGWYTQATGGDLWDFSNPVNYNMTLYAHWAAALILPTAGAIPLQQLGGGSLLALSVLSAVVYAAHILTAQRKHIPRHSPRTASSR